MAQPALGAARRRPRLTALVTLALLNVTCLAAGSLLAWRLPGRLALWRLPLVASRPVIRAGAVLDGTSGTGPLPTTAGLAAALSRLLSAAALGPHVTAAVADPSSGRILFARNPASPAAPASTAKLATAVAALDTLGPAARFTTTVVEDPAAPHVAGAVPLVVLVGGGDPTLTAGPPPAGGYPAPATLQELAAAAARALRARGSHTVRLGYDISLFRGAGLAPGWPASYVTTGNVTPITALAVDQGRLLPGGKPQDADAGNSRPRTFTPSAGAAAAFAAFLAGDGIRITGHVGQVLAARGAALLAAVRSPPLAAIVEQMLTESNNVIAEDLARHVALATGMPPTFGGAAAAVRKVISGLGAGAGLHLADGSGLSPQDRITAAALVRLVSLAGSAAHPALRPVLTGLPVAGFSGTLASGGSVFGDPPSAARGLVRAKTGNLSTVISLAGLAYDRGGAVLAFAFMADRLPSAQDLAAAAVVMDKLAAALAGCGCR